MPFGDFIAARNALAKAVRRPDLKQLEKPSLAAARGLLAAGGHPATSPTLDAIRDTLHAVPTPDVNGRLTHALARRGLEALAGLVVAPRPTPQATQVDTRGPDDGSPEAQPDQRAERAEAAIAAAAHALGERQAEHTSARDAVSAAQRLVEANAQAPSHDAGRAVGLSPRAPTARPAARPSPSPR